MHRRQDSAQRAEPDFLVQRTSGDARGIQPKVRGVRRLAQVLAILIRGTFIDVGSVSTVTGTPLASPMFARMMPESHTDVEPRLKPEH